MKTFTAKSMPDVLAMVKQTYGSHGVILHTRSIRKGGLLGVGGRLMVEVTATDGRQLAEKYRRKPDVNDRRRAAQAKSTLAEMLPATRNQPPRPADPSAGDLIRRTYAAARSDFGASPSPAPSHQSITPQGPHASTYATAASAPTPTLAVSPSIVPASAGSRAAETSKPSPAPIVISRPAPDLQLAEELSAMKQMMVKMMRQQKAVIPPSRAKAAAATTPELPDPLVSHYLKLIEQEVAEELAEEVVSKVGALLTQAEFADEAKVRRAVHDEIARRLPVEPDTSELKPTDDGRPRTIALIGPTGVGKTTTIAKLAATFKLRQNKKVGLITMDTYRIAAVEQLRTYAGIIGLPLKVVDSSEALAEALDAYRDLDVVLIDTAGRSQRASDKLDELSQLLNAADPHEVHLVLSSTVSQKVLLQTIDRFSAVKTDRIIFTKLDEAVTGGVLLNVARRVGKKVSYITTGQEVPNEIEPGCSDRLASLVMGESGGARVASEQAASGDG